MVVHRILNTSPTSTPVAPVFQKYSTAQRPTSFRQPLKKSLHLSFVRRQQTQLRQNSNSSGCTSPPIDLSTSDVVNYNPYYPVDLPSHLPQFLSTPTTPLIPMPLTMTGSSQLVRDDTWSSSSGKKELKKEEAMDEMDSEFDFVSSLDAGSSPTDDLTSSWTPSHASTSSNTPGSPEAWACLKDPLMTDVILNFQCKKVERLLLESSELCKRTNGYNSEDNTHDDLSELQEPQHCDPSHWLALSSRASSSQRRTSQQSHKSVSQSRAGGTGSRGTAAKHKPSGQQSKRTAGAAHRRNVPLTTSHHRSINLNSSSYASSSSGSTTSGSNTRKRHLLQFIVDLLSGAAGQQSCVQWVSKSEKIFRICDPNELTNMWGVYKNNMNMSFESLSRSLRLYYAPGKLERIQGRRHQYRLIGGILWPGRS